MTIFSSTASPGQRWKMFLPSAASIQSNVLSMSTASALIRSRWLNAGGMVGRFYHRENMRASFKSRRIYPIRRTWQSIPCKAVPGQTQTIENPLRFITA
jgi:hypothetical protein